MSFEDRVSSLRRELEDFHNEQKGRHKWNFRLHWILVISVLACTVVTTAAGILRWPYELIALTGMAGSMFVALHAALAIGDKAEFQRIIASEAANLLSDINQGTLTEQSFEELRKHFKELRKHADVQLPRGGGMDAVRGLPKAPSAVSGGG